MSPAHRSKARTYSALPQRFRSTHPPRVRPFAHPAHLTNWVAFDRVASQASVEPQTRSLLEGAIMNRFVFAAHASLVLVVCACGASAAAGPQSANGVPAHMVVTVEPHHGSEVPP